MSLVQIILVVIVAFIIGCSSVNDQIETYQPVVACSLIGLVTGHLELGVMLGGSLQLITSGWANVGAAMAPDASLAAVASTIILILGGQGAKGIGPAIALAVPLAVAGLALTMFVRTATVFISHIMDGRVFHRCTSVRIGLGCWFAFIVAQDRQSRQRKRETVNNPSIFVII